MSDTPSTPDWWQASDGKWYSPEAHPDFRPAVPPPPTAPMPPRDQVVPWQVPPSTASTLGVGPPSGVPMAAGPAETISGLARVLNVMFIGWLVLGVATLVNLFIERSLLTDVQDNPFSVSFSDLEASDDRTGLLALIFLLLLLATAIVFLTWMNKAYKNLKFFGATTLRRSTGWSVGGWFIPIVSLWFPYQAMRDIWVGSDPDRTVGYPSGWWSQGAGAAVVKWWWGLWLASGLLGWQVFGSDEIDLDQALTNNMFGIVNELIGLASAVAALLLVKQVTARQVARAAASGAQI